MSRKTDSTAYKAIEAKAKELGWPAHYREDLTVHDRKRINGFFDVKDFAWAIHESGTHIFPAGTIHALSYAHSTHKVYGERLCWFKWASGRLVEVKAEDAIAWLEQSVVGKRMYIEAYPPGSFNFAGTFSRMTDSGHVRLITESNRERGCEYRFLIHENERSRRS